MESGAIRNGAPGAWATVLLLSLVYLCGLLDRIVLSLVLSPLQKTFGVGDAAAGLLAGAAFGLPFVVASLPLGWAADRFNRRNLVIAALVVWSLMTLGCGLASTFALLFVFRMGVGVGEAVQTPCASSMIGDLFGPRTRPVAFGVYLTAGALGVSLAFLMGGALVHALSQVPKLSLPLLGVTPAWRVTLMSSAAPGLALALALIFLLREPARRREPASPEPATAATNLEFARFLLANKAVTLAVVIGIPTITAGVYTFINWMPVYFSRIHGWAPGKSSIVFATTCGAAAFFGALLVGLLPGLLRWLRVPAATLVACLIMGVWMNGFGALAMSAPDPQAAISLLTLALFGLMTTSVLALAAINEVTPPRLRARFTATFTVGIGILTNSVGSFLAGALTQHVFRSPATIGLSLQIVWLGSMIIGGLCLLAGLPGYRRLLAASPAEAQL